MADRPREDRSYSPDTVSANRAARQGQGVGQRDLQVMRDPGEDIADADLDLADEAREEPGMQTGQTHANRPDKTDAQSGQGRLTREANRERFKGNPDYTG
jgi:hypothetical protein